MADVLDRIEADLAAALGGNVQVVQGTRASVKVTKDLVVFIGRVRFADTSPAMGDDFSSLAFDIDIVYSATKRGPDAQPAANRAAEGLYDTGSAALRRNAATIRADLGLLDARPLGSGQLAPVANDKAREAAVSSVFHAEQDVEP